MNQLADPFSKAHPLFWPVLWLSLRAFTAWTGRLIEAGHGYAGLRVEITWYGWIHVTHLDLSPQRAAFNRRMLGVEDEGWRGVLARAGRAVDGLLAPPPLRPAALLRRRRSAILPRLRGRCPQGGGGTQCAPPSRARAPFDLRLRRSPLPPQAGEDETALI